MASILGNSTGEFRGAYVSFVFLLFYIIVLGMIIWVFVKGRLRERFHSRK